MGSGSCNSEGCSQEKSILRIQTWGGCHRNGIHLFIFKYLFGCVGSKMQSVRCSSWNRDQTWPHCTGSSGLAIGPPGKSQEWCLNPGGSAVRNSPTMQETQVPSLGWEDPLEKEIATHPSILPKKFHGERSLTDYSPWGC